MVYISYWNLLQVASFVFGKLALLSCRPIFGARLLVLTRHQSVFDKLAAACIFPPSAESRRQKHIKSSRRQIKTLFFSNSGGYNTWNPVEIPRRISSLEYCLQEKVKPVQWLCSYALIWNGLDHITLGKGRFSFVSEYTSQDKYTLLNSCC
jgi:hypothetical protein